MLTITADATYNKTMEGLDHSLKRWLNNAYQFGLSINIELDADWQKIEPLKEDFSD